MFSRKKKRDKKHKPGMTEAELSKLEEAAVRRGFFNVRKVEKTDASTRDQSEPEGTSKSVLEKAAMYGKTVLSRGDHKHQQQVPMPVPTHRLNATKDALSGQSDHFQQPVPPSRRKSSKSSKHHSYNQQQQHGSHPSGYVDPNALNGGTSQPPPPLGYSVPTPWRPVSDWNNGNSQDSPSATYDYPSPVKKSMAFNPMVKTVVLRKRKSGDFGISLRRSSIIEHSSTGSSIKRTVYFAEPGSQMQMSGEPTPLSHGDRLIAIGDKNMEGASREDIIRMIKSAKDQLSITVEPISESTSAIQRNMKMKDPDVGDASLSKYLSQRDHGEPENMPEPDVVADHEASNSVNDNVLDVDPVFDESQWKKTDDVWCIRDDSFLASSLLEYTGEPGTSQLPAGKVRIKFKLSSETAVVDEEKIEKANSSESDLTENISTLRFLNVCGVLNTLQHRYNDGSNYTYAGPHLMVVRPIQFHSGRPSDKVMTTVNNRHRSDIPAHIFSCAQTAYSEMTATGNDQSVVLLGYSGSGKSSNMWNILHYLTTVNLNTNQVSVDKLSAMATILESFTTARTSTCARTLRSVNLYTMNYNSSGQVGSIAIQCTLVEYSRVVRRPPGEENFSIFYQILEGADSQLSRELFLIAAEQHENPCLFEKENSSRPELWKDECLNGFKKLKDAMATIGFSTDETKAIFNILASCLHLMIAGSQTVSQSRYQFLKPDAAQKASSLLGISMEDIARAIFQPSSSQGEDLQFTGEENLNAFITGLFTEAFKLVISLINRSLFSSNFNTKSSIVVVDAPGIQCSSTQQVRYASLEDLTFNLVQERLQLLFHHYAYTRPQERYQQENVFCEFEAIDGDVTAVADAIDRLPTQIKVSSTDLLGESKGILWLLDEESLISDASEESFVERLDMLHGKVVKNGSPIISKGSEMRHFIINHLMGSCPIEYNAANWLKSCIDNPLSRVVSAILCDSKKSYISNTIRGGSNTEAGFSGSVVGLDNNLNLRRGPSMRKMWKMSSSNISVAVMKKKSLLMSRKLQIDNLIDTLKRTQINFVFCFTPNHAENHGHFDISFMRQQLKGSRLLPATRIHRQGYPEHMVFSEFRQSYEVLCKHLDMDPLSSSISSYDGKKFYDKEATEQILKICDIERSQYKLGISQVLFRFGILSQLESKRNQKLTPIVTALQARCRGYLGRKEYVKRKVQTVAIRCIQRNVRKFLVVRQWPWWRLLTKVLPLVEVNKSEADLREREAELSLLKSKYEKVLKERNDFKEENEKYERQLNNIVSELSDEQAVSTHASEMLEQETKEKLKLERELKDIQSRNQNLRNRYEMIEVELAEYRLMHSTNQDGASDSDDDIDASEYKLRYDRKSRETEIKHKKQIAELEERIDQTESDKRQLGKKIHQMEEEMEEQERLLSQQKKKAQKSFAELHDAQFHLEETNAKLHELGKKQRKFDSELYAAQAELTEMKSARDKLQRERDELSVQVHIKNSTLEENSDDMDTLKRKIERLEQELEETTAKDSDDGQQLNNLKKQRREMEAKIKDQEEELDDQAGMIQVLQQTKERLEMAAERTRQQHSKELDGKEEELEEMRVSYQKKIKHLESQLEEDQEEHSAEVKYRRQLEQQLAELKDNQPYANRDVEAEKRLRKDVKRYKVLLDDAQTLIDHLKTDAVNKQQLKQMSAQLEESQYTCANAIKSKKAIELELEDVQAQLEEISKAKQEVESKISLLQREKNELNSRIEEDEDDSKELSRKYKNLITQQCEDRKEIVELISQIDDLTREKEAQKEKVLSLQCQLEYLQENTVDKTNAVRLESKSKDLEMKLDFEKTTSRRLETQLGRLKDQLEKLQSECDSHAASEHREKEQSKRLQKQLRDAKDNESQILKREQEALQKQHELELELMEKSNQSESLQADLKLAFKRISDLQIALEDLDDSDAEGISMSDDSDLESDGEGVESWRSITSKSRISGSKFSVRPSSKYSAEKDYMHYSSDESSNGSDKVYLRREDAAESTDDESDV